MALPRYRALAAAAGQQVIVNERAAIDAANAIHSWPGPTIEAISNEPVYVLWKNELPHEHLLAAELNRTRSMLHCGLMARNCTPDVRTVIHLHGGHTLPMWGQKNNGCTTR